MPEPEAPDSPAPGPETAAPPTEAPPPSPIEPDAVMDALRTVKDPELGVNLLDLGLIYTMQTRRSEVDVEMTLTSPACPAGPEMLRNAVAAIEKVPGVSKANVKLVLSPPWSPERMTDEARDELGMF